MKSERTPRPLLMDQKVSEAAARLDVTYAEPAEVQSRCAEAGVQPMAIVTFGQTIPHIFSCPVITLDLPQLEGPLLSEVWTSDRPIHTREVTGGFMAMNGDFLLGAIALDEAAGTSLDAVTYEGYREMLHQLRELGYPHLWRAWNYFPRINEDQDGLERYRRFCVGRHQALIETMADFPSSLPAATAIGTKSGPLQLVFLAGMQPSTHLGNPRQLNAYEYPREYGPCSPSFARATLARFENECLLFIAGTSSVVGHTSCHVGFPIEQTRETAQNLRAVLNQAKHTTGIDLVRMQRRAFYKVYVRNSDLLSDIRRVLQESPLPHDRLLFLQGDLCRKELLVEIEGLIISD